MYGENKYAHQVLKVASMAWPILTTQFSKSTSREMSNRGLKGGFGWLILGSIDSILSYY